jgi:hypothetical protein
MTHSMLPYLPDVLLAIGVACVISGVWWIYPPAGLILLGAALVAAAVFGAKL